VLWHLLRARRCVTALILVLRSVLLDFADDAIDEILPAISFLHSHLCRTTVKRFFSRFRWKDGHALLHRYDIFKISK
jgi:hypothetical protein